MDELLQIEIKIADLRARIKAGSVTPEDATKELESLRVEKLKIEQRNAATKVPQPAEGTTDDKAVYRSIAKAMQERKSVSLRAITLNGTGNVTVVKQLTSVWTKKKPLLGMVHFNYGNSAQDIIPVLSARPAKPAKKAEGATDGTSDTAAAVTPLTLIPAAYLSILPVTAEAIAMGAVDIESELPLIMQEAFADGLHDDILVGASDNSVVGAFTSVPTANLTETSFLLSDLAALALKVADKSDSAMIIMSSTVYAKYMADTSTDETTKLYKEMLIRDKTIEGVKILLTSSAPTSVAAGATVAIAIDPGQYEAGIAGDFLLEPLKKVGDTNTYYQATMFLAGKSTAVNTYGLKAAA